ncbi:MAG: transporter ATP-binding protein [Bacillales bacterium]|jgi:iron complex transport system ATP-binding protein|nr:transporter ATP-binding protein [Bacillales bacterium]
MLRVLDYTTGYSKQKPILQNISFEVPKGSFCAVLGANGSGKTTLIRGIMGLLTNSSGEVFVEGKATSTFSKRELAQKISVLTQEQPVNMDFTSEEIVLLGRYPYTYGSIFRDIKESDYQLIDECFEMTNATHLRNRIFTSLSGGERQRVLLAKAFAQEPSLLFLDEPTNHLDIKHSLELLKLLKQQQEQNGLTIVAVLHDLNLASLFADQLIFMKNGQLLADGRVELFNNMKVMKEVFGIELKTMPHPETGKPQIFY